MSPDIASVGEIFNVFGYDAVKGRISKLSFSRQQANELRATTQSRVLFYVDIITAA